MMQNGGEVSEPSGELPFIIPRICPKYTRQYGTFLGKLVPVDDADAVAIMTETWAKYTEPKSEFWHAFHMAGRKRKPRQKTDTSGEADNGPMVDADGNRVWNDNAVPGSTAVEQGAEAGTDAANGDDEIKVDPVPEPKPQMTAETRRAMTTRMKKLDVIARKYRDPELTQTVMEIHTLLAL